MAPTIGRGTDFALKKFSAFCEAQVSVIYIALEDFDQLCEELPERKLIEFME